MTDHSVVGDEPLATALAHLITKPDQHFSATTPRSPITSLYPADDFLPATVIATGSDGTPYLVPVVCERVEGVAIYPEPLLEQPAGAAVPTSVRFELKGRWRLQHVETGTELPMRVHDNVAARRAAEDLTAAERRGHVHVGCAHVGCALDLERWTTNWCSATTGHAEAPVAAEPVGRFA